MNAEIIEGEAVEIGESRELVVVRQQPGQALVAEATPTGPAEMIGKASAIASALRDIVERQRLYATISGKKYPQVEAWSTIGRMDNVVAREASRPIRHDDGSYEAEVELVRLSDGMVIGRASALCGMADDKPWNSRAEYARRSMAVTRATSRAFRQQYSWIMALAGYEPTPADEMPSELLSGTGRAAAPSSPARPAAANATVGTAKVGNGQSDFELRQTPDGNAIAFRLQTGPRSGIKVIALGSLADDVAAARPLLEDHEVTCYGVVKEESFDKDGKTIRYNVLTLERIETADLRIPALSVAPAGAPTTPEPESPPEPWVLSDAALGANR